MKLRLAPPPTTSSTATYMKGVWTIRVKHHFPVGGWWGILDAVGHKLRLPQFVGPVPLMRIVCDHFDIAVGLPREQLITMDYDGKAPWWLA